MMLKPLILSGAGVAFFTPLGFLRELEAGEVVAIRISGSRVNDIEVGIVTPRRRQLTRATELVIEYLSTELEEFTSRLKVYIGE